ncbi:hypothetical protein GCK72_003468 [Caenorhabditis remanei]|uniref:Uncharacterized protein n=1 Tax=Caenorhabditis remanei TaxID=31234 RepID=A0A6A5HWH4_CAERE|nr:hypothetical protein GCK72_003468 [Caenorhabditis remanei]KAF1771641.1 hypothetical protein GCK72_003468 [Caenorhabditis remanei]
MDPEQQDTPIQQRLHLIASDPHNDYPYHELSHNPFEFSPSDLFDSIGSAHFRPRPFEELAPSADCLNAELRSMSQRMRVVQRHRRVRDGPPTDDEAPPTTLQRLLELAQPSDSVNEHPPDEQAPPPPAQISSAPSGSAATPQST